MDTENLKLIVDLISGISGDATTALIVYFAINFLIGIGKSFVIGYLIYTIAKVLFKLIKELSFGRKMFELTGLSSFYDYDLDSGKNAFRKYMIMAKEFLYIDNYGKIKEKKEIK